MGFWHSVRGKGLMNGYEKEDLIINKALNDIERVMYQTHGREISMYDESFLIKMLKKRLNATGVKTVKTYLGYLAVNSSEAEEFSALLNINYSEFFRNPLAFALLEQWILPQLIEEKSGGEEIRVWSAGCAAGQEAYSIAILLDKLDVSRANRVRFRIFATDISESSLALAREGVYDADAVQNVRLKHLAKYFTKQGDTYTITPELKDRVNFSTYDLLDKLSVNPPESIYGDFDIVFCSNLLFYYRPEIREFILHKVQPSLSAKGYLVTGEAERAFVAKTDGFRMVAPPAAVFQKKGKECVL
jgi:chemotaxis methyl-accepting protein methylase